MKFGLFVPQGWRMDLVGIDPAQHWGVMAGLARRGDVTRIKIKPQVDQWVFDEGTDDERSVIERLRQVRAR